MNPNVVEDQWYSKYATRRCLLADIELSRDCLANLLHCLKLLCVCVPARSSR